MIYSGSINDPLIIY